MPEKCSIFSPRGPMVYYKQLSRPFSEDYPIELICKEKLLVFKEDPSLAVSLFEDIRKGIMNNGIFDQKKDYKIRFTIEYGDRVDKISLTAEIARIESPQSEPNFKDDVVIKICFAKQ